MLSRTTIHHTEGAIKNWTLNYAPWLLPGEVLSTVDMDLSSNSLNISGTEIHLGKHIHFTLSDGAAGETATITVTVTTSKTETKIETLTVHVNNP